MFIEPMQGIDSIGGVGGIGSAKGAQQNNGMFIDIFRQSIQNVLETDAAVAADTLALATGEVDDLHTLGINQSKAQLSISLLVQMRNGFLDAYNEIMRMSL